MRPPELRRFCATGLTKGERQRGQIVWCSPSSAGSAARKQSEQTSQTKLILRDGMMDSTGNEPLPISYAQPNLV